MESVTLVQSTYIQQNITSRVVIPCRTYADKLSPKVVQSLLDLLCSQLKNLLSQAGVSLLSTGEDNKHEDSADSEKKDFRGDKKIQICLSLSWFSDEDALSLMSFMIIHSL